MYINYFFDNIISGFFLIFKEFKLIRNLPEITQVIVICTELLKLFTLVVCVMVGNAKAERVFSCQNRIKSKLRTKIKLDTLDTLIRISYSRVAVGDFDFNEAIDTFLNMQPRRL